jgi:hypothetical protein
MELSRYVFPDFSWSCHYCYWKPSLKKRFFGHWDHCRPLWRPYQVWQPSKSVRKAKREKILWGKVGQIFTHGVNCPPTWCRVSNQSQINHSTHANCYIPSRASQRPGQTNYKNQIREQRESDLLRRLLSSRLKSWRNVNAYVCLCMEIVFIYSYLSN